MSRLTRTIYLLYIGLILVVLYFPFVIMAILSFQGPRGGHTFPMNGTSIIWYWKLFNPGAVTEFSDVGEFLGDYLAALRRSLMLAIVTAVISTVFGMMAAQVFRRPFRGSSAIFYLWLLGIIVPGTTVSLGLALVFKQLGVPLHWLTTGLAVHVMWTLPFSLVIFLMFYNRFDNSLEDAALTLGANKWRTFWHVTLPVMQPAVLTSLLFAFTLSLDEFQRSLLITGTEQTLPLMVMASVTTRVTPSLYALGSITTLMSFAVVTIYLWMLSRSLKRAQS
ncbi:MAG: ABC transporter permease [Alphaproteobacteria bacterium]|nr:ABC transporter permease [Alphaproteobacteria bacterium]